MPSSMSDIQPSRKVTVEQLLKLKRHERPDREFWNRFESELNARRLQALVNKPGILDRCLFLLRKSLLWATPVAGLVAVSLFFYTQPPVSDHSGDAGTAGTVTGATEAVAVAPVSQERPLEFASASPERESLSPSMPAQFIVNSLSADSARQAVHYRRVLNAPSFSVESAQASRYVADPISSSRNALIHQAGFSSGRNF